MRAERLIALILLLQRREGTQAQELADALGVSARTVYRDLDVLSAMGVPVISDVGRGGGVRLLPGYKSELSGLRTEDAEALALLASPGGDAERVLDRLASAVPHAQSLAHDFARQRMLFDAVPWFAESRLEGALDALKGAIWNNLRVAMLYERLDGRARQYDVAPYAMVAKVDLWYLVAVTAAGMRVFRVSRVLSLTVSDEVFTRDEHFDLHRFWREWTKRFEANPPDHFPVEVEISRAGVAAIVASEGRRIGRFLDDSTFDRDGWARAVLDLETEDRALKVLLALGDQVSIARPQALVEKLRSVAEGVLRATS